MMLTLSRPYCQAFTDKKPGNVCSAKTKVIGDWGFDVAEYAYVYNHSTKKFDYVGVGLVYDYVYLFSLSI
ncbi:hypothetical protein RIB2604_02109740 [Aspergillus luchuensis]|uniref:Uncharacterized protein n=1 Tax=Aspergillus kawachii TaxID=1069201 RepID=A0A146FNA5_ASPKA|nr:hypothetical protein RIB2604_02109740 [Aspergillus luchuensis]